MAETKSAARKLLQYSFGFDPEESRHHFLVTIPRRTSQPVTISEHHTWDPENGSSDPQLQPGDGQIRILLPRPKWDAIADEVRVEFNRRLKNWGLATGRWRTGPNLVRRELGKELLLLAWAIEDADPALIPTALANWKGLYPEERWWLYTQTAAATGHAVNDRGKGWRRALRYALTENPVTEGVLERPPLPEFYRRSAAQGRLFAQRSGSDEDLIIADSQDGEEA
ncbi:MAG: DUF3780 domain-containing protein [Acidobacteriota bacterium]